MNTKKLGKYINLPLGQTVPVNKVYTGEQVQQIEFFLSQ